MFTDSFQSRMPIVPHVSINANPDFSAFAKDPIKLTKTKGSKHASEISMGLPQMRQPHYA
jgi:hypothetical protein